MRPACLNTLFREVTALPGIGPKLAKLVQSLCGLYWVDVLFHLPNGVNYRPVISSLNEVNPGQLGTIEFKVLEHVKPPRRQIPYRVLGTWNKTLVELLFFNYHADYLNGKLVVGQTYFVSGRLDKYAGQLKILHPDYIARVLPQIPRYEAIYPLTGGVSGKVLAKAISGILERLPVLPEWLDTAFQKQKEFPDWKSAILKVHNPQNSEELSPLHPARQRLAYDELLANQLALFLVRAHQKKQKGLSLTGKPQKETYVLNNLPFVLTNAQQRVIEEIRRDLNSPDKMTRLLQGDVGSGKTIVALTALLISVDAGYQGVFMVPTDILARQHLMALEKLSAGSGIRFALLTGREKGKKREALLQALLNGEIDILIGTHAVFVDDVIYHKLGLVIIDEQHKFGVHQRLALTQKQKGVNLLVMTATPIPRTLALTAYGDMDISILDEKPAHRRPIETRVIPVSKVEEIMLKLHEKTHNTSEKTQVYWVCPLVEESEKSDLMAAQKRYESLQEIFGARVGLVHGKMKGAEKDSVMARFAAGELDVLVATTVIEVGVDIQTATVMVIEHAERFGLAALHQLRGRVGRGSSQSVCLLLYGGLSETARARLKVMRESENGFVIAEEDLRLRGAGELLGTRQSGLPEFKMADLSVHYHLLTTAAQDAKTILTLDPALKSERGQALRTLLYLFQKDSEVNTLKAG